jgi:GNAT superfamily N-acetyltransferase
MHIVEMTMEQLRASAGELFKQHYAEIAQDKSIPLEPDWPAYKVMEESGLILCVGAVVGDTLVGYSLNFVYARHLHYASLCFAQNDIFFVTKAHRGKQCGASATVGDQLRAETKRLAKERGARKVFWHAKKDTAMSTWLARTGCKVADLIYSEEL